jgi:hypothetical protein
MSTETILEEVLVKRIEQIDQGYTPEHDAEHGVAHVLYQAQIRMPETDWWAGEPVIVAAVELMDSQS